MKHCHENRENIILADCEKEELTELAEGMRDVIGKPFHIKSNICNKWHGKLAKVKRYLIYAWYPVKFVLGHSRYEYIIGWQQFFTLFFVCYCRLFHVKKNNIVVALNFTYKEKKGWAGSIYHRFMKYCVDNDYLDYIHVLSRNYARLCADSFHIPEDRFIVTPFGLPDTYGRWKNSSVEYKDYCFAIGRSNRDFDFLVRAWRGLPESEMLVIASDTYKPREKLPCNVIHRTDIGGDDQFPYIANCKMIIIPIDDAAICSGDTVLLKAMSYEKPVVVTAPSTLAEMYIEDGTDGILVEKREEALIDTVTLVLQNPAVLSHLGKNARKKYLKQFSRYSLGERIGKCISKQSGRKNEYKNQ